MWKKTDKGKTEKPNHLKRHPTISFRSNLSPLALNHIKKASSNKDKSRFINQAIEMRYFYETDKAKFLKNVLQEDYELCRHLLRKEGQNGLEKNKKTDK